MTKAKEASINYRSSRPAPEQSEGVVEGSAVPTAESHTTPGVSDQGERAQQPAPPAPLPVRPVQGEDFYWEGPYMVFTEAWHLKRGYCCGSACRHCPYNHENVPKQSDRDSR